MGARQIGWGVKPSSVSRKAAGCVCEIRVGWIFSTALQWPAWSDPMWAVPATGMYPVKSYFKPWFTKTGMLTSVSKPMLHMLRLICPAWSWWYLSMARHRQVGAPRRAARIDCSWDQVRIRSLRVQLPVSCMWCVMVNWIGVLAMLWSTETMPSAVSSRLSQLMSNASARSQVRKCCAHSALSFWPWLGPQLHKLSLNQL